MSPEFRDSNRYQADNYISVQFSGNGKNIQSGNMSEILSTSETLKISATGLEKLTHFGESVKRLEVKECKNLKSIDLTTAKSLKELMIINCGQLESIEGLQDSPVEYLAITGCSINLNMDVLLEFPHLKKVKVKKMEDLQKIKERLEERQIKIRVQEKSKNIRNDLNSNLQFTIFPDTKSQHFQIRKL